MNEFEVKCPECQKVWPKFSAQGGMVQIRNQCFACKPSATDEEWAGVHGLRKQAVGDHDMLFDDGLGEVREIHGGAEEMFCREMATLRRAGFEVLGMGRNVGEGYWAMLERKKRPATEQPGPQIVKMPPPGRGSK